MSPARSFPGHSLSGTEENVWWVINGTSASIDASRAAAKPAASSILDFWLVDWKTRVRFSFGENAISIKGDIREKKLLNKLKELYYDKVFIIISHRLSTLELCDEKIYLGNQSVETLKNLEEVRNKLLKIKHKELNEN